MSIHKNNAPAVIRRPRPKCKLNDIIAERSHDSSWRKGGGFHQVIDRADISGTQMSGVIARTKNGLYVYCFVRILSEREMEFTDLSGNQTRAFRLQIQNKCRPAVCVDGRVLTFTANSESWYHRLP